ncbi:mitochondrial import receptor subunit TOM22, putative [Plasmodium ovale]|uniref:Mitochondrial import receptor subunit TOM22, putative n=2 Tax=Plasmodium ovale TaxID=36330 RepID=A0A1A8XDC9_PLAOA|nr:mitochondrial import receptor subunit TOM22, putative [Plasmodium ovale curtisi]SBT02320.1 mitochondrial import receptor subunit TOM22, putative [Plasmodium ovale curtisi]SCQ16419.1 mitochondrial import receptor subunit TOM22, putative [Plasmodium ovale]
MYKHNTYDNAYYYTYLQHIPIGDSYNIYLFVIYFKMGMVLSKIMTNSEESSMLLSKKTLLNFKKNDTSRIKNKLKLAKNRINNIMKKGFKTTSWVVWVAGVSVVVLITPIAFQYEKECQLFEMQAQFFQAQQAANVPQLN